MFPPVDNAVLENNPDFANLYIKLTKSILNPDGSTKDDPISKQRRELQTELDKYRLKLAKQRLLTHAISITTPPDQSKIRLSRRPTRQQQTLHEPLLDLLFILPALFDPENPIPPESIDLLMSSPPLTDLEELLPDLATLVSSTLRSSALDLTRIANPSTNPSYLHRHITSLPKSLSTLISDEAAATQSLAEDRLKALSSLITLLGEYTTVLTQLLRTLESKHGVVARSIELRAKSISLQAQHCELEAESALWNMTKEVYPPGATEALQNYTLHLRDAKARVEERRRGLSSELGEYGVGVKGEERKTRAIEEMAKVYRELGKQMDDTKGDLVRLRKGSR